MNAAATLDGGTNKIPERIAHRSAAEIMETSYYVCFSTGGVNTGAEAL